MTRHRSVKRILLFSSGVRYMFAIACAGAFWAILVLHAASGRHDLLARTRAHLDSANRVRGADVTVGEQLRRPLAAANEPGRRQRFLGDFAALGQPAQILEAHRLVLHAENVGEAALRQASRERHLAALELRLSAARTVVTRARLDSLVSLAGSLACARSGAPAEPLSVAVRAGCRNQVVQADALGCGFLFCLRHCFSP